MCIRFKLMAASVLFIYALINNSCEKVVENVMQL